jgi:hypothetical protein
MRNNFMSLNLVRFILPSIVGLGLAVSQLQAAVTISVAAEKLTDPGGQAMAVSGILVLVADADDNGFGGPSDTAFVQGDDVLLGVWDIASGGGNAPGAFLGETNVTLSGNLGAGDKLAVMWFPTLAASNPIENTSPGASVPFGMYTIAGTPQSGGNEWVVPADGPLVAISLRFITTDATALGFAGLSDPSEGVASQLTPGTGPTAPSGVAGAASGAGKIVVTWTDNSSDETGFRIERREGANGAWGLVGSVAAGVSMFDDTNSVQSGKSYYYRVVALRDASWSAYSELSAEVISAAASARFTNISTRAMVGTGDEILIASFQVTGGPLRIYTRVQGPNLAGSGITNFLADPTVKIVPFGQIDNVIKANDNWKDDESELLGIVPAGVLPKADAEAAMIVNLTTGGLYSIVVSGVGNSVGVANVELYEFRDPAEPNPGKLSNLSVRAPVGTGDDILIASFQVTGDAPQRIYASAGGQRLESFGITNFLPDSIMRLVPAGSIDNIIKENDNWKDDQSEITGIVPNGVIPKFDPESALVVTLPQNALYSVVIRGVDDVTGFANVELYDFPQP